MTVTPMTKTDQEAQAAAALDPNAIVRVRDLDAIVQGVVDAVQQSWRAELATEQARREVLAGRVGEIEALTSKGLLTFEGVWSPSATYERGASVTWDGSLWVARTPTQGQRPGSGASSWQLAVKHGRDAR